MSSFCQLRQYRISSALDDGRELPGSLQRHIDSCHCCGDFYARSNKIASELSAATTSTETPPWLSTRIMARVQAASQEEAPAPSALRRWLPAATGLATVAIAAGVVISSQKDDSGTEESTAEPVKEIVEPPAEPSLYAVTTPVHPATVPSKLEAHAKGALSKEAQHLAADLRGARNFLKSSFRSTLPGMGEE